MCDFVCFAALLLPLNIESVFDDGTRLLTQNWLSGYDNVKVLYQSYTRCKPYKTLTLLLPQRSDDENGFNSSHPNFKKFVICI